MRKIMFFLIFALISSLFVTVAVAAVSPSPSPTDIPLLTPTPSPNSTVISVIPTSIPDNLTVTPSPTPYSSVGVESVNPNGQTLFFGTYNQTTIALTYASAVSYSVNVTSLDPNHFEYGRPIGMTATLNGVNTYVVRFQVLYDQVVNQTITLSISSGDGKTTYLPLTSFNRGFTLDVTVTTSVLDHIASPQEIWDYGNGVQQEMIANQTKQFEAEQTLTRTILIVVGAVAAVCVVVVAIVVRWARRVDRRQIARKYQGYGELQRSN